MGNYEWIGFPFETGEHVMVPAISREQLVEEMCNCYVQALLATDVDALVAEIMAEPLEG